jgi:hypothetical protein
LLGERWREVDRCPQGLRRLELGNDPGPWRWVANDDLWRARCFAPVELTNSAIRGGVKGALTLFARTFNLNSVISINWN